jgi:hypothetical protein
MFSSIGITGSELPIRKSCKPVLAAFGTGFFSSLPGSFRLILFNSAEVAEQEEHASR